MTRPTPPLARWPWWAVGITALAGLVITLLVEQHALRGQHAQAQEHFRQQVENLHHHVEDELRVISEVLDSIRALHAVSDEISPTALNEFVTLAMAHQRRVLGGFGFAQRISHRLREALEESHRAAPETGYKITEWSPTGDSLRPAQLRPIYYPLTWQDSAHALQVPTGFDFGGFPAATEAIQRMASAPQTVIVPQPIPNVFGTTYWIFSPIFHAPRSADPEQASSTFIGFAIGLLEPEPLLQRAAERSGLSPDYAYALTPPTAAEPGTPSATTAGHEWRAVREIPVLDRHWMLTVQRAAPPLPTRIWTILLTGLSLTLLVTSQLAWIADRHRRVAHEVQLRTRELQTANEQLAAEMQERSRLENALREATAAERRQLGRDLHDSLGQKLTGAVFLSRSLVQRCTAHDPDGAAHAQQLNATLKESVQQVRDLARGLAPIELHGEGLADALPQLAREISGLFSVRCTVEHAADTPWPTQPMVQETLYMIAREAVYNAARHGQPDMITIHWQRDNADHVCLTISDDGTGMPAPQTEGCGLGIHSMRQRAHSLQAELRLEPNTPRGTRVICRCPTAHIYGPESTPPARDSA